MQKNKSLPSWLPMVPVFAAAVLLLVLEIFPPVYSADETLNGIISAIVTRAIGSAIFIPLAIRFGYRIYGFVRENRVRAVLTVIPAFLVVINNLPIIGLCSGNAKVTSPAGYVFLFAAESFLIGLFEEFAFRGVLYMAVLETRRSDTGQIFRVTVASSAVFGAVHLFNLFLGAGPVGVILQMGYSFLIGGMCSIVLLKTHNIWICVLLHGIFDFCGYLVPTLGDGIIWDAVTVAMTAVLGVCVLIHMVIVLSRVCPVDIEPMFPRHSDEKAGDD